MQRFSEDVVTSYFASDFGLKVASKDLASTVFMETGAEGLKSLPDVYGFHALSRLNPVLFRRLIRNHQV